MDEDVDMVFKQYIDEDVEGRLGDLSEVESFHGDDSNRDDSDDDLLYQQNVDQGVEDRLGEFDDSADSSKYGASDEEREALGSDEDEVVYPVFNEDADMEKPKFVLGMMFSSSNLFRQAVKKHAIVERRPIVNVSNYGKKVKYICKEPCKWRIYASALQRSKTYQIKSLVSEHTCMPTYQQKMITSSWIAKYYENEIRMNPTWPIPAFHKNIVNDFHCEVSKHAVYRAKRKALKVINGTHEEQYSLVWDYGNQLKKALPGSTVKIKVEAPEQEAASGRFLRFYICLNPLKIAFVQFCRYIVGLDGCHLKGPFGGQLLSAVGLDANDGMYPIAWALVEAETTETWTWFLDYLCRDLQIQNDSLWTFISDRQKGLINALESIVPNAEHRFCVMHLYQNMHKEFKGIALRQLLWKAARSTTEWEFNLHMNKMKEVSSKCYDWLMAKPKQQWTRHAFRSNVCSDMFVNNHSEVFNSSIRKFRDLPIITMFREIHKAVMKRIQVRRDKMAGRDLVICPSAQKKLNKAIQFASGCAVTWSGGTSYSVTTTDGGHELVVDLFKKTYTYRKWDLTGIPCFHSCACIVIRNDPLHLYINDCYKKGMYMQLYSSILEPIVGQEHWEKTQLPRPLPPNVKIQTGRPKKKRSAKNDIPHDNNVLRRENTSCKCTYCKAWGHNSRTCAAKISDLKKKAEAEGRVPHIEKTTVKCKICQQTGHNSRTCPQKKQDAIALFHESIHDGLDISWDKMMLLLQDDIVDTSVVQDDVATASVVQDDVVAASVELEDVTTDASMVQEKVGVASMVLEDVFVAASMIQEDSGQITQEEPRTPTKYTKETAQKRIPPVVKVTLPSMGVRKSTRAKRQRST